MQSYLRTYFKGECTRTEKPLLGIPSKFKEKQENGGVARISREISPLALCSAKLR